MKVTEHHAQRMLRISGYDQEEARALLAGLTFPAELDEVTERFFRYGITTDRLMDLMGGSP